jgi:hypothetical protein
MTTINVFSLNPLLLAKIVAMITAFFTATGALAAPPKVIKAIPDNGDSDVDPAVAELRFEFDQDMSDGGFSICGGGPTFPQIDSPPKWESPRVLVVAVKLKPEFTYNLSINCPAAQNTRGASGEAAEIYPITFTTGKIGGARTTPKLSPEQNKEAIKRLREAIDKGYAYRDLHKIDWNKAIDTAAPKLESADTAASFAREVAKLLEKAKDLHNTVKVGDQLLATFKRTVTPNVNQETLAKAVPEFARANDAVWTGRYDDGIGYINITTWSQSPGLLQAATDALDKFEHAKGVIIDVRFNSGGDESLAREFASCFVAESAIYSKNRYCDPSSKDGFGQTYDRRVDPHKTRKPFRGKVAALIGPANMSSCESFILMLKHGANARLFGEKTFGASGNPKPHELGNGVTVYLSSWQDLFPDGKLLEGKGISPDTEVKTKPTDPATADPVIEAALKWIRN